MAKQGRISRKELKEDQTLETFESVYFWISHNRNMLIAVFVVVVAAALGAGILLQRGEFRAAESSNKLFQAFQKYERAFAEHGWASPGRAEAMQEVRTLADEIVAEFPGTPAARNALFLKGNAYYFQGDAIGQTANTERAIEVFTQYLGQAQDPFERASALLSLGYAHENLYILQASDNIEIARAALGGALEYYDQLIAMEGAGFLRYEGMLAKARLYAFQGETDEAIEILTTVVRERGNFPEPPGPEADDFEFMLYQVMEIANTFSTANTARIQLQRLGVDTEQLLEDIRAEQAAEEATAAATRRR